MAPAVIARATHRYPSRGKVRPSDRRAARYALALTGGSGFVVVSRRGPEGCARASRIARAWDELVLDAEERHRRFWAEYDANRQKCVK